MVRLTYLKPDIKNTWWNFFANEIWLYLDLLDQNLKYHGGYPSQFWNPRFTRRKNRVVWPYLTIWADFCTKYERVRFLPSKEKNWTFFLIENRPLQVMAQIDVSLLWIESTHLEDVSNLLLCYSILKTCSFIFSAAKWELCMIP